MLPSPYLFRPVSLDLTPSAATCRLAIAELFCFTAPPPRIPCALPLPSPALKPVSCSPRFTLGVSRALPSLQVSRLILSLPEDGVAQIFGAHGSPAPFVYELTLFPVSSSVVQGAGSSHQACWNRFS